MFGCSLISNPERAPLARLRGAGGSVERGFFVIAELAKGYRADVETLTAQIANKRRLLSSADSFMRYELNRELSLLYEMRRDAILTAEILERYYKDGASRGGCWSGNAHLLGEFRTMGNFF